MDHVAAQRIPTKEAPMKKRDQMTQVVAEISLYGVAACGYGTIVRLADGRMIGTGEPVKNHTATSAIWLALDDIEQAHAARSLKGAVAIVHYDFPRGPKMATVPMVGIAPSFGDLKWTNGSVYEISAEAIIAASAAQKEA
jgi:hypothetical protein